MLVGLEEATAAQPHMGKCKIEKCFQSARLMKTYLVWTSASGYAGVADIGLAPAHHKQVENWIKYTKHLFSDTG